MRDMVRNPLRTRQDAVRAAVNMLESLIFRLTPRTHILLCAVFSEAGDAFPETLPKEIEMLAQEL